MLLKYRWLFRILPKVENRNEHEKTENYNTANDGYEKSFSRENSRSTVLPNATRPGKRWELDGGIEGLLFTKGVSPRSLSSRNTRASALRRASSLALRNMSASPDLRKVSASADADEIGPGEGTSLTTWTGWIGVTIVF